MVRRIAAIMFEPSFFFSVLGIDNWKRNSEMANRNSENEKRHRMLDANLHALMCTAAVVLCWPALIADGFVRLRECE